MTKKKEAVEKIESLEVHPVWRTLDGTIFESVLDATGHARVLARKKEVEKIVRKELTFGYMVDGNSPQPEDIVDFISDNWVKLKKAMENSDKEDV